jgi:general secretion pathway protein J
MTRDDGFTLVELLVALALFGLIATMGVALLGGSVRAQDANRRHLARVDEVGRVANLLALDLGSATGGPRTFSAADAASGPVLSFTRVGPPSGREVVTLRLDQGSLLRVSGARTVTLVRGVSRVIVRQRFKGLWGRAEAGGSTPDAVELTVERVGLAPLRLVFVVGARSQ